MRGFARIAVAVGAAAHLVAGAGCASGRRPVYVDERANFAAVRRVALLPLDNYSSDRHAAEKVRQVLTIELLRARAFEVVDSGEVGLALTQAKIERLDAITAEQAKFLGDKLGVEALFLGAVQEMTVDRSGGVSSPTVSLHFRLLDAASGQTIWSTVVSREGVGIATRLFGVGGKSTNETVQDLVREALRTLIR